MNNVRLEVSVGAYHEVRKEIRLEIFWKVKDEGIFKNDFHDDGEVRDKVIRKVQRSV